MNRALHVAPAHSMAEPCAQWGFPCLLAEWRADLEFSLHV